MNNDILKQFYWGKQPPWERSHNNSETDKLHAAIDADVLSLKERLSDEDKTVLSRLISNLSILESEQVFHGYVDGFTDGVRLMIEVLKS